MTEETYQQFTEEQWKYLRENKRVELIAKDEEGKPTGVKHHLVYQRRMLFGHWHETVNLASTGMLLACRRVIR